MQELVISIVLTVRYLIGLQRFLFCWQPAKTVWTKKQRVNDGIGF